MAMRVFTALAVATAVAQAKRRVEVDDDNDAASKPLTITAGDADAGKNADKKDWLNTTNMLRCMHDAPAVTWNDDLQKKAQEWVETMPPMQHNPDIYEMTPPQGENLAMNMPDKDIVGRVKHWYSEVEDCDELPGCENSKTPGKEVGHFTALIWKGVREIGCASNKGSDDAWYYVCRYASGPSKSPDTANMLPHHKEQVFAKSKEESECKQAGERVAEKSKDDEEKSKRAKTTTTTTTTTDEDE